MKRARIFQAFGILFLTLFVTGAVVPVVAAQEQASGQAAQEEAAQAQESQTEAAQETAQEEKKAVTTYTLPPERYQKAVAYARAGNWLYFVSIAWSVVVVLLVLFGRIPAKFRDWAEGVSGRSFVQAMVFVPLISLTLDILDLPTSLYGHWLSLRYEQSVQGWGSWFWDWSKSEMIGLVIGIPVIWLLYFSIRRSPRRWWLYFWLASVPFIILLLWLAPVVIAPLFNKFEPLEKNQPALVAEIEKVVARGGLEIPRERMFEMLASEKTNAVNAYVTGFGDTLRVVVWDTTLAKMTPEQTLFVFGHEMGHYVLNHIYRGIAVAVVTVLLFLFLAFRLIHWVLARWGGRWAIRGVEDWASFPALLLILSLAGFLATPVLVGLSRMQEHEADIYGLEVIHGLVPESNRVAAEAFQVLGEINLADPDPGTFIKLWRYGHPPLKERVEFAYEYDPWGKGEEPQFVK